MKNRRILKVGVSGIIIALLLCLAISLYIKLEEPVFFQSYSEYIIRSDENPEGQLFQQNLEFSIQYVTNVTDRRTVLDVSFPEAPELYINASNNNPSFFTGFFQHGDTQIGTTYGRYSVRSIFVTIMGNGEELFEDLLLTRATVIFNNGDIQDIDIGEIIIYGETHPENYLESRSNSGSSDGTSQTTFKVEKDITLIEIYSPLLEEVNGMLDLKVDDVDYSDILGMTFEVGSYLNINSNFSGPMDIEQIYNSYSVMPVMHYKDNEGNLYTQRIYNMNYTPLYNGELGFTSLLKYLYEKGEI